MHSPLLGYHLLTSGSTATHYSTKYTKTVTTSCQILIHNTSWIIAQNLYDTRNTCIQTVGPPSLYMLEQKRVGVEQRTATTFKQAIATNTHNTAHKRHTTSKSLSIVALLVIDKKKTHTATKPQSIRLHGWIHLTVMVHPHGLVPYFYIAFFWGRQRYKPLNKTLMSWPHTQTFGPTRLTFSHQSTQTQS